jgi:hypothetical protein
MLRDLVKNMRSRISKHTGKKPVRMSDVVSEIDMENDVIELAAYEVLKALGDYIGWGFHVYVFTSHKKCKLTGTYLTKLGVTGYKKVMDDYTEMVDQQLELSVSKAVSKSTNYPDPGPNTLTSL